MFRYTMDMQDGLLSMSGSEELTFDCPRKAQREAYRALLAMVEDTLPDEQDRVFRTIVRDEAGQVIYEATLTLRAEWRVPLPE